MSEYLPQLLFTEELVESVLRPRVPDFIVESTHWFFGMLSQYGELFLIGIIMALILSYILFIEYPRRLGRKIVGNHVRTEFSTVFERVWRWLPITKSTVVQYEEFGCTFDELEEKFDEELR